MASAPVDRRRASRLPTSDGKPPVKSILRGTATPRIASPPPTVLGNRKRAEDEDFKTPDSPTKRPKSVHFDDTPSTSLRSSQTGLKTLNEAKKEVKAALDAHARGDLMLFNELKSLFESDRDGGHEVGEEDERAKPEDLVTYVIALTGYAPRLNSPCFGLVKALLYCSWLGRDDNFNRVYCQFLAALVSAHGTYMPVVLKSIVEKFTWTRPTSWNVPNFPDVDRETMEERLHSALAYILQLFPAARTAISKVISDKFPFPEDSKRAHLAYVKNLLRLKEYAPNLGSEIIELITNRIVKLDVEMTLDLDEVDDEMVAKVLFQVVGPTTDQSIDDGDDVDSDNESVLSDDAPDDPQIRRVERATTLVKTLDAVLDVLFGLFAPHFEQADSEEGRRIFEALLSDFTNHILPTQRSRHTQFLIFHFSQKSPDLVDMFAGTLLNVASDTRRQQAIRQAAAAYLGSFVARGAHVSRDTARSIAEVLCNWIETFRQNNAGSCMGPDLRRYHQFYFWFQSLIYIFCFRWRDLVDSYPSIVDPDDPSSYLGQHLQWMRGLKETITNAIHSPFNPLKVCTQPIVQEFCKLAHNLHLAYLYPKLEANRNVQLAQFVTGMYGRGDALRETGHDMTDEKWLQLESYFPFDPYQLPKSKQWIEGDYLPWDPIPGLDDDDRDEEDDSEDDDDVVDDEELEEEGTGTEDSYGRR